MHDEGFFDMIYVDEEQPRIGGNHGDTTGCRYALGAGFDLHQFFIAGETSQVVDDRYFLSVARLGRQENAELHCALCHGAFMGKMFDHTAKALVLLQQLQSHYYLALL
jgi:hypothetical protein